MIISCKCLNIAIIIPNDNHISSTISSSKSNEQFQVDRLKFLNKCFANDEEEAKLIFVRKVEQIDGMENIRMAIELNELVQIKLITNNKSTNNNNNNNDYGDEWNIYKCLNCNSITHGLCNINNNGNNTRENNLTALNCAYQIPVADFNTLKQSNGFSPVFNIIITKPLLNLNIFGTGRNDKILPKIAALKDRYHNFLVTEMKATEQRISEYREKETQLFNEFKYRGEQEYNLLVSLISNAPDDNTNIDKLTSSPKITHLDTPPTTPDSAPIECSPPFKQQKTQWPSSGLPPTSASNINKTSAIQMQQQQKQSPNNKPPPMIKPHPSVINDSNKNAMMINSTLTTKLNKHQPDADCLFDLDDDLVNDIDANHDDNDDYFNSSQNNTLVDYDLNSIDDIDNDDNIDDLDDINPIRQYTKQQSINLAKSLPISMPMLAGGMRTNDHELDDDDKIVEDNIDIAASIKALAKSVHGDTVFGDLPRPRFSTQI